MSINTHAASISASRLCKTFSTREGDTHAFREVDVSIAAGEFVCLLGPSGCGKSTFLRTLAGLETASSGELHIKTGKQHAPRLAMVFQEHGLFPWMTVKNNLRFPLENLPHFQDKDLDAICDFFLQRIGLSKFADYYPEQLSGGMRQRASIARAYATEPQLLLLDEPFVFLDYQTRLTLQDLLLDIWQEHQPTVVFVTHDIEEAVLLADRICVMSRHPGTIKREVRIELPRPRSSFEIKKHTKFMDYVADITDDIRQEMQVLT